MRKLSLLGLFALLLTFTLQQQASAWLNFKFGAGINWNWQSGGNNTLWGLFRNGQPPGFGNNCDPSCAPTGGINPFNIGPCMPQQPLMMIQPQFMPQQGPPACGPQGCNTPGFPSFGNGHYYPHEFQFFGKQENAQPATLNDSSKQTSAAYGYGYNPGYQANYYPASSSSYHGTGYYPSSSSSYYGSGYYPATSSSYYGAYGASSYYPSYQTNPYGYYYNGYGR